MPSKVSVNNSLKSLRGPAAALLGCLALLPAIVAAEAPRERVDFDRDVRPILGANCLTCHGFDPQTRQGGLRLDTLEGATKPGASGKKAIVPGDPAASELLKRVTVDNGLRMPPASTGKTLKPEQVAILRRWIEQGARYAEHWAFTAPKPAPLPVVKLKSWPVNPIDRFVLARLEKEGLKPSPPADRTTLIRRVTFDLTGLPPTPAEVNAFQGDTRPDAYERLVDRLLASPRYGERMAMPWLDMSRYADTHGYHIDSHRDMWPWRNWVIDAFNRNLSYDQFVIQQLAGDLLPNATLDQKIATGFNRNHPINFEGGAIPEEYQTAYVLDRVDTTATAFMGLTMKCAQCHDHKYDPLTQKEFYGFYAYFNNIRENGLDGQSGNAAPFIKAPTAEQQTQLAAYDRKIGELEQAANARAAQVAAARASWERTMADADGSSVVSAGLAAHYGLDEMTGAQVRDAAGLQTAGQVQGKAGWTQGRFGGALTFDGTNYADLGTGVQFDRTDRFSYGAWVHPTANDGMAVVSRMDDSAASRGWDLYLSGGKVFVHLIHEWDKNAIRVNTKNAIPLNAWSHVFATYDGSGKAEGVKVYVDGKPAPVDVTHNNLTGTIQASVPVHIGRRSTAASFRGMIDEVRLYTRELSAAEVTQLAGFDAIRQIAATPAEKRTAEQQQTLSRYYLENFDEPYRQLSAELADQRKKRTELDASIPTTMVMEELPQPRETRLLIRGQYDVKGEPVKPITPAVLPPLPADAPPNRLTLAKWLVNPAHPLTARVAVNRYWQMYFGLGLVRTSENFGTQSEPPSHPELLDWLALRFANGAGDVKPWDVKAMQRLIVTSAAYRQQSALTPTLREKDPENRLLARGPRFRLPAEVVRDNALAVSGLLVEKRGGPSVKPYQPAGLWEEIAFGGNFTAQKYEQDHGEALYRRSMYTFWKRTCPPPSLQTFDAPEREFCIVRRSATNTPLQALVTMNDPAFVEAARKLGERMMTEVAAVPKDRLRYAFRLVLARQPKDEEVRVLLGIQQEQLGVFRKDPAAAEKLLSVGESPRNKSLDAAELAAWTAVANVILNLDETVTKN